jgi:hypothetical protein
VPMKMWHGPFVGGVPFIEVRVVKKGNKLEKDLAVKRLVRITFNDGRDDRIAIDAES